MVHTINYTVEACKAKLAVYAKAYALRRDSRLLKRVNKLIRTIKSLQG